MITMRGDLASAKMKKAVKAACGADIPASQAVGLEGDNGVAWMSPDELLVMVAYEGVNDVLDGLHNDLAGEHFLAVNVSDARGVFEIKGDSVREVIAKLCPVDMSRDAFKPGQFRRSRMAQVPAAFWMVDEQTIRIVCFRSVAEYVFGLLKDAAEPGGDVGFL